MLVTQDIEQIVDMDTCMHGIPSVIGCVVSKEGIEIMNMQANRPRELIMRCWRTWFWADVVAFAALLDVRRVAAGMMKS